MQAEVTEKPKLFSHRTRGNSQIIRSTLLQLGVQFEEILIKPNGRIQSSNAKYAIQTDKLPCLVHDENVIYEILPILKYLCTYFNKKELFGKDVNEMIRISEILVKYSNQKNSTLTVLLMGIKQISIKKLGVQAFPKLADIFLDMLFKGQHHQAMEDMFEKTGGFLCGELTVLDFIFYEKCFLYGNILLKTNKKRVQKMIKYIDFFQETEFYLKNKSYLQSFCLYDQKIDEQCMVLLEEFWSGDKNILQFKKSQKSQ